LTKMTNLAALKSIMTLKRLLLYCCILSENTLRRVFDSLYAPTRGSRCETGKVIQKALNIPPNLYHEGIGGVQNRVIVFALIQY